MEHKEFSQLVHERQAVCIDVLSHKDKEYSSDADRLHNFKAAGRMSGCSPEMALWGMFAKHLVSVKDEIDKMDGNPQYAPPSTWADEKIGDCINYLHLLEGLIAERQNLQPE
jgi:hypothetical protein